MAANRDPLANVSGLQSKEPSAYLIDAIEAAKTETDSLRKEQLNQAVKLLAVLNGYDLKYLDTSIQKIMT
jgi:hypothetical protein